MVEPVGEKQIAVASPGFYRRDGRVVIGKIVVGDLRVHTFTHIPIIFVGQGGGVVFAVASDKKLPQLLTFNQMNAGNR